MAEFSFTVHGNPIPKARPRIASSGYIYTPAKTKTWEQEVALRYREAQGPQFGAARLGISLIFWRGDALRVDLDNLIKSALDGLNGVAFDDDAQVTMLQAAVFHDRQHPRLEATLWELAT